MMNKSGDANSNDMDQEVMSQSSYSRSCSYVTDTDPSDLSPESETPPWKRWSNSLQDLLDDPVGNQLFRDFLHEEQAEAVHLFYLACQGLKHQNSQEKRARLVQIIYKKLVQPQSALVLMPETRARLDEIFASEKEVEQWQHGGIFDEAQKEAWRVMERDLYPNFIASEKYSVYVNSQLDVSPSAHSPAQERSMSSGTTSTLAADEKTQPLNHPPTVSRIVCPQSTSGQAPYLNEKPAKVKPPVPVRASLMPPSSVTPGVTHLSGDTGRQSMRRLALEKDKVLPSAPVRNGALNTPPALTKEVLASSQWSRRADNEKIADQVWQEEEKGVNKPYYSKYAPYVPPSGLESEVSARQSQSGRSRPANQNRQNGDYVLDFSQAQRMAQVNRDPKTNLILPTTTHERRLGCMTSREMDQRKMKAEPEEFARLLTSKLEKVAQEQQQVKPANFSGPSHSRMASLLSGMAGLKIPLVAAEADDSDNVLEEHFDRVGKMATPDSHGSSLCHSPHPPLRIQQQPPPITSTHKPLVAPPSAHSAHHQPMQQQRHQTSKNPEGPPPAYTKSSRPSAQPPLHSHAPHPKEETDSGYSAATGTSHAQEFVSHPYQNIQLNAHRVPYPQPPLPPKKHSSPAPAFTSPSTGRHSKPRLAPLDLQTSSRQGLVAGGMSGREGEARTRSRSQGPRRGGKGGGREEEKETTAMFRVGQQGEFYMTKMHGTPTLANFKSVLPGSVATSSKSRTSYYFKKPMEGVPFVWDEVKDDNQLLPIMEGRVTATIETLH